MSALYLTKDNLTYDTWYKILRMKVTEQYGIDPEDCEDWLSRNAYDSGETIEEAIETWKESVDFPEGL